MPELKDIVFMGVAPDWFSRKSIISLIEKTQPYAFTPEAYNTHADLSNKVNAVPITYGPSGSRICGEALALALKNEPWEAKMAEGLLHTDFQYKLNYFWHQNFREIGINPKQPLQGMLWEGMAASMALAILLGQMDEGIYQGYLAYATIKRDFQLQLSYKEMHRRGYTLMLRLFAAWCNDGTGHKWPAYAYDEPIYEGILERWREADPEVLKPWLIAACDRHTHQSKHDSDKVYYDFSGQARFPLEILFVLRLRELEGLQNPVLDHPLMAPPFDHMPAHQPLFEPNEYMIATLKRVREDWPNFDETLSLNIIRRYAQG